MSTELFNSILSELESIRLIDPHSHINPHAAASSSLADILGYHYYTELCHSAGMPREQIEEEGISPREKVGRLVRWLPHIENTVQYSWLIEMCRTFFDFDDETIAESNWERLYDRSEEILAAPSWETDVLQRSGLDAVFLTNDFDDPLEGFDTNVYVPCLRTDDLVFHLGKDAVRDRVASSTGVEVGSPADIESALGILFRRFTERGAKACAISLPPDFAPCPVSEADAAAALTKIRQGDQDQAECLAGFVFWKLAEHCREFGLPFDLMIGVNRGVYPAGVFQGRDLFDKRTSLLNYQELFNAFPDVTFPVSVLAQTSNQELVSYSWIFPNVVPNGHWWYSNIPAYIETDCRSRLEAVPQTRQIGYYSDMYKLEFALPKFAMYRRVLASVLARDFVQARGWSEDRAVGLGRRVLRENVEEIFAI